MSEVYLLKFIESKKEVEGVFTFRFEPDRVQWRAGQFMAIQFREISPHLSEYEHWFSISSAPYQGVIEITVRESSSPFKQRLLSLKPGELVEGHTVDGDFDWPADSSPIFVAGGIGITPFISMLRQRKHESGEMGADLYYFTRPDNSILFLNELEQLQQQFSELDIFHLTHKPLSLKQHVPQLVIKQNQPVYIAGPVPMVDRIGQELSDLGANVHRDYYFGYDVRNY